MEILQKLLDLLLEAAPVVVIVVLFYGVLRANFFLPLERVMSERAMRTEGARKAGEAAQAAAAEKLRAYDEALKKARATLYAEQEVARRLALEERTKLVRESRAKANEEIRQEKDRVAQEMTRARAELEAESAALANEIARAILERRPPSPGAGARR